MYMMLAIAAGGGLGAVLRYLVSHALMQALGQNVPHGTFLVNVSGSILLGIAVAVLARYFEGNDVLRAFLTVGLLGGFTTFSAFALDSMVLMERGEFLLAAGYVLLSVIGAIGGLWLGLNSMRAVLG